MPQPLLEVADLSVRFDTDDGAVHAVDRLSYPQTGRWNPIRRESTVAELFVRK